MSRKWTLLTLILFLGSGGTLQAQPQEAPDIVYIDGSPCNRACQSYMEWSYRALSARRHEARETIVAIPAGAKTDRIEPVVRPRAARHAAPVSRAAPHAAKSASNGRTTGNKASSSKKIASANVSSQTPKKGIAAAALPSQPAASETAAEAKPAVKSEVATAVTLPPPATLGIAARPAAPPTTATASEAGKAASASPDDLDNLVALVLAGPEINSLSDLNNRNIVSDVHVPFAKIWRDGLQRVGATDCKSVDQRVANR